MNSELLTIDDICNELHIGKSTAYKLTKTGKIKSKKIGKHILTTKSSLSEYIKKTIDNKED